jgi:hypothetical protein
MFRHCRRDGQDEMGTLPREKSLVHRRARWRVADFTLVRHSIGMQAPSWEYNKLFSPSLELSLPVAMEQKREGRKEKGRKRTGPLELSDSDPPHTI